MGSFTPLPPFVDFSSALIEIISKIASTQCHEFFGHACAVAHVPDGDLAQNVFYALAHPAQRFAHGATAGLPAFAAGGNARRQEQRTFNRADHFKSGDRARIASQQVTTVSSV